MGLSVMIRERLRRAGLDLIPFRPEKSWAAHVRLLFQLHDFDLVLDVGANVGQYAVWLRSIGYRGRIVSFEPLSEAYGKLIDRARHDPTWQVAPRMALGANEGIATLNIAGNSQSSSILGMLPEHVAAAPDSRYVGKEEVRLARLEDVGKGALRDSRRPFLKIDTQGYEEEVLRGAGGIMSAICGVQLELSVVPLYKGERPLPEMITLLESLGFACHALFPGFIDHKSGRLLQMDGIFIRESPRG